VRACPHAYARGHLANSAFLLLPVSNLTSLLAFSVSGLSFGGFAVASAAGANPAWAAPGGALVLAARAARLRRRRGPRGIHQIRGWRPSCPRCCYAWRARGCRYAC